MHSFIWDRKGARFASLFWNDCGVVVAMPVFPPTFSNAYVIFRMSQRNRNNRDEEDKDRKGRTDMR